MLLEIVVLFRVAEDIIVAMPEVEAEGRKSGRIKTAVAKVLPTIISFTKDVAILITSWLLGQGGVCPVTCRLSEHVFCTVSINGTFFISAWGVTEG